jgi:hypothetical protein
VRLYGQQRPLLKQECLYKQSACDKHYVCFSFSADDKMTLCLQGILRVWSQQRTLRCMLHFDIHCAARKEIHEGIAVTNKRSPTSVNNEGVKSKHKAQAPVARKRHTWLRYELTKHLHMHDQAGTTMHTKTGTRLSQTLK